MQYTKLVYILVYSGTRKLKKRFRNTNNMEINNGTQIEENKG